VAVACRGCGRCARQAVCAQVVRWRGGAWRGAAACRRGAWQVAAGVCVVWCSAAACDALKADSTPATHSVVLTQAWKQAASQVLRQQVIEDVHAAHTRVHVGTAVIWCMQQAMRRRCHGVTCAQERDARATAAGAVSLTQARRWYRKWQW